MRILALSFSVGLSLAVCGSAAAQYSYPPPPPYIPPEEDDWQPVPPPRYYGPPPPLLPLPLPPLPIVRPPGEIGPGGRVQPPPPSAGYGPPPGPSYGSAPGPGYGPAPPPGPGYAPPAAPPPRFSSLPREYAPEDGAPQELPERFKRQVVVFPTREPVGTLVIDTANTYLYLVLGDGRAMRYGIGVGREGFTWSGAERVSKMAEWPDWHPPAEMIERQPDLPRFMAGGEGNPLGARALYLGKTLYRIHGTNQPSTIGTFVSSGCIRLTNADIEDLYRRVKVGTRVVVLPGDAARRPPAVRESPNFEPRGHY